MVGTATFSCCRRYVFRRVVLIGAGAAQQREQYEATQRLEARSQREGPVGITPCVDRPRVIPAHDREVEEVHPKARSPAAERIPLRLRIESLGSAPGHLLSFTPGQTHVVKQEAVDRRESEGGADVETADEWKAKLGVRNRDAAAGELGVVAVERVTDSARAVDAAEVRPVVTAHEIRPADVFLEESLVGTHRNRAAEAGRDSEPVEDDRVVAAIIGEKIREVELAEIL